MVVPVRLLRGLRYFLPTLAPCILFLDPRGEGVNWLHKLPSDLYMNTMEHVCTNTYTYLYKQTKYINVATIWKYIVNIILKI